MSVIETSRLVGVRDERKRVLAILSRLHEKALLRWQGDGKTRGSHTRYDEAQVDAYDMALIEVTVGEAKGE